MTVAYGIKGKVSLLKLMKTDICHLVPNLPYAVRCRNGKFTNSSRKFLSLLYGTYVPTALQAVNL